MYTSQCFFAYRGVHEIECRCELTRNLLGVNFPNARIRGVGGEIPEGRQLLSEHVEVPGTEGHVVSVQDVAVRAQVVVVVKLSERKVCIFTKVINYYKLDAI